MSESQMFADRIFVLSVPACFSSSSIFARICAVCFLASGTGSSATWPAR